MLEKFLDYIKENKLFLGEEKVLLGISGGVDSIVLADLFKKAGFSFGIAHCNFSLRGEDSDVDEDFVKKLAESYGVIFHSRRFNTSETAVKEKNSIQMAARNLRYKWFEQLREKFEYKYVAVAHHSDDDIETFFINLVRGTGISGLAGIQSKSNSVVRPLLFATRNEILDYAKINELKWREDASNLSEKYLRNNIRLKLIPLLKKFNPSVNEILNRDILQLKEINKIYRQAIREKRNSLFFRSSDGECFSVYLDELKKLSPPDTWSYELFSPFGFSSDSCKQIFESFDASPGKQFFSKTHRIVKDREMIFISPLNCYGQKTIDVEVSEKSEKVTYPIPIQFEVLLKLDDFTIPPSSSIACLDADKLKFPLTIRKWQQGDKFVPLGMKGFKKVSDYLIDQKIPLHLKDGIFVMTSQKEIVWIIGHRIDERFKIEKSSSRIFKSEVLKIINE